MDVKTQTPPGLANQIQDNHKCKDPNHSFPKLVFNNIVLGQSYKHICPTCGRELTIRRTGLPT